MVRVKLVVFRQRVLQGGDLKDGEGRIGVEFQQLDGQTGKPARKVEAAQHVRMPHVLAVSALDDRHGILRYAQFVQTPRGDEVFRRAVHVPKAALSRRVIGVGLLL